MTPVRKKTSKRVLIEVTGPMGTGKNFEQRKIYGILSETNKVYFIDEGFTNNKNGVPRFFSGYKIT